MNQIDESATQFGGVPRALPQNSLIPMVSEKNEYNVDAQEDMCSAVRLLFAMVLLGAVVIYCIVGGADRVMGDGGFFLF